MARWAQAEAVVGDLVSFLLLLFVFPVVLIAALAARLLDLWYRLRR
jgi:hypothetical protein